MAEVSLDVVMKVVDSVDVMLGYWDCDLRCRFANAAYWIWFGKRREELIGISMKELLGPVFEANLPHIRGVLAGETQIFERDIAHPDGTVRHSLACYFPDIVDGVVQGFMVQVSNVSRLKQLEFELQAAKRRADEQAMHDYLTGLPNRRLLMEEMDAAMRRSMRTRKMFGVIAIDLNDFKAVNDTYGHQAGDTVLRTIAERMNAAIRSSDLVARLGGDEFVLLAQDVTAQEELIPLLQRLVQVVCRPIGLERGSVTPNLGIGVALFPVHATCEAGLLARADEALYEAKRLGENRYVFARGPGEPESAGANPEPLLGLG